MTTETPPVVTPTADPPVVDPAAPKEPVKPPLAVLFEPNPDDPPKDPDPDDTVPGGGGDPEAPPAGITKEGDPPKEPGAGEGDDPPGSDLTFAPDTGYEKFTYPEQVPIDDTMEKSFQELATKLNGGKGLNQKDAQALVDWQAEGFEAMQRAAVETHKEWDKQSYVDPRYGGAKAASTDQHVDAFLTMVENFAIADNFEAGQGVREALKSTGWISHPGVRRALAFAGEQLAAEPGPPLGHRDTPPEVGDISTAAGRAKILYGGKKAPQ